MDTSTKNSISPPIIGVYKPYGHPSWYYIGEWSMKYGCVHFKGIFARAYYNGMVTRSFSFLPAEYDMSGDVQLEKIRKIDGYKYHYIKEELNRLFENLKKWINLIPENVGPISKNGLYEFDNGITYKSPSAIYCPVLKNVDWDF